MSGTKTKRLDSEILPFLKFSYYTACILHGGRRTYIPILNTETNEHRFFGQQDLCIVRFSFLFECITICWISFKQIEILTSWHRDYAFVSHSGIYNTIKKMQTWRASRITSNTKLQASRKFQRLDGWRDGLWGRLGKCFFLCTYGLYCQCNLSQYVRKPYNQFKFCY